MPAILCILDGWGHAPSKDSAGAGRTNAILEAQTPNYDSLIANYPNALLRTSGRDVGLPDGQMGNSDVGHMIIGAGEVLLQDLPNINEQIRLGALDKYIERNIKTTKCHVLGLISDGGVHSHILHYIEIAKLLTKHNITPVLHAITDGRDTTPFSCMRYIEMIENAGFQISSIAGRYYAMDRDNNWDRTYAYRDCISLHSDKITKYNSPSQYIQEMYDKNISDEFIMPALSNNYAGLTSDDSIIFTNFRADRMRQIASCFGVAEHTKCMPKAFSVMEYSPAISEYSSSIFEKQKPQNTLGKIISDAKLKQLRIAETEKYAHVTSFFNGGKTDAFEGEDRILVPSKKINTFDMTPEMSAREITIKIKECGVNYDFICINYANADMVGHTGNMSATIKAIEVLDECVGQLMRFSEEENFDLVITADHGNAECMIDHKTNKAITSHTTNPVPIIYYGKKDVTLANGSLADIKQIILNLLKI